MPNGNPLIALLVIGLGLAFVFGLLASKLRTSPLVGYLLAGVAVGPFTPGFDADPVLAFELAEVGVILLMFGVGLNFSFEELKTVRAVAVPAAIVQMPCSVLAGFGLGWVFGLPAGGALALGLTLSVASTVVLTRSFQEGRLMESEAGRIAIGWLVSQDLLTVFILVLLPIVAPLIGGGQGPAISPHLGHLAMLIGETVAKVIGFVLLMLLVGRRVIPMILHYVAHTGSRELFRLAVLSVALGVAFVAADLFGVSFALGAFVAGMVLSGSQLSLRAAEETLPLRDAFAVLFFISVGMLVDPAVIAKEPLRLIGLLAVILVITPGLCLLLLRAMGRNWATSLTVAAGFAQIGEFSFVLAALTLDLHLISQDIRDLVLAGSIISIILNPFLFYLLRRYRPWIDRMDGVHPPVAQAASGRPRIARTSLTDHIILIGHGRVGRRLAGGLRAAGRPLLVIEMAEGAALDHEAGGGAVISGNAAHPEVLEAANLSAARLVVVAIPNAFEAGQIVAQTRAAKPGMPIIARAHSDQEVAHLRKLGASLVIMGEEELARRMLDHSRVLLGSPANDEDALPPDEAGPNDERENAVLDTR